MLLQNTDTYLPARRHIPEDNILHAFTWITKRNETSRYIRKGRGGCSAKQLLASQEQYIELTGYFNMPVIRRQAVTHIGTRDVDIIHLALKVHPLR
jgi:hypothetical protein